ncbi:nicotinate phosphoribosyltransferase [Candidatus Geothermarchaeota archaeon]|nr:MAG: nicotinate phosphoribosyltransferase [Candidatus Geothermarchaeota archaeon]
MRIFHSALDEEIKKGLTTDVYFVRTKKILERYGLGDKRVVMEITTSSLPNGWKWGVLTGTVEFMRLLEGLKVDVYVMPEGTIFKPEDISGVKIPVAFIDGPYGEFCIYETPMLGFLCQSSGVSTTAARIRLKAWDKILLAFGARRMHPSITPMLDWATYVGGFDGVSTLLGAEVIRRKPMGTMPHALIIVFGDQVKAWRAFDDVVDREVPRIMLVDTFFDEKMESLMAAEEFKGRIYGVRLDTPSSRRGKMGQIIKEVRWELDIRGFKNVKIIVSGGINEENIDELVKAGADGFGIGTSVSNAPTVDFAADIVEVDGKPIAKRGKFSGRKQVWRCEDCLTFKVTIWNEEEAKCPYCGKNMKKLLKKVIKEGKIIERIPTASEAREYVLKQLEKIREIGGLNFDP